MDPNTGQPRHVWIAAAVILTGIVLSGPVAVTLVEVLAPQPKWQGIATFIEHYSWLQTLPYAFGFLIAGGFILLFASVPVEEKQGGHNLRRMALGFAAVSAALIYFNYVLQLAFIPLSLQESPSIVAVMTMANPNSLGWALEMFGYAVLGIGTAFIAPLFHRSKRQRMIGRLLVLNCLVSVLGAALMPFVPGWVLSPAGMVLGAAWNVLVVAIMVLILLEFRVGRR